MSEVLIYDLTKVSAELCRREFSFFVKEFWSVIIAEELKWEPHLDILCKEIQAVYERVFLQPDPNDPEPDPKKKKKTRLKKEYDLIINIPPGLSKSTIVTIMAPAWAWTRDATLRVITGSYSNDLATEHSVKSRDIITSDKYQLYFPEVEIKDHKGLKTNYETTANGQRFATSVGGTVTGVHAHVKNIDDPLNPKQAASQVETKAANDWIDKTLSTRNIDNDVTVQVLIMQRVGVNDPTGYLLAKKKGNVRLVCLPGLIENRDKHNVSPKEYAEIYVNGLLSPLRLGHAALAEKRIDLGSSGFAGQIIQLPAPDGGTIWQKWFNEVPDDQFPSMDVANEIGTDWDLAYTKDEKNSANAWITSGMIQENIYIFDLGWKWLEFPELIKLIKSRRGPHYIEGKASGKSARQTLKRSGVVATEVKVNSDKVARAKDATPTAEAGMVFIKKSLADKLYNDAQQGILFFPNGQHNDLSDTLSQMIVRRVKKGKLTVANNQAPEDIDGSVDDDNTSSSLSNDTLLNLI
jgi:predicted phage terminase large subunit-like protein